MVEVHGYEWGREIYKLGGTETNFIEYELESLLEISRQDYIRLWNYEYELSLKLRDSDELWMREGATGYYSGVAIKHKW